MERTTPHPASNNAQRRAFLRSGGLLLTVLTTGAALASRQARADDGLLSQASVHYQKMPHDGQQCSNCAYFIPGKTATDTGSCRLVSGTIYPDGWCVRFSS
ncbi:MAG: high-potential iron-sulfur protein [Betaproteobacteria bacterium]|nr:high-potential iron-sulfur protein [Betaproteobacteria bacterium]MDE2122755.1 high-potential iron-sulfur protein [Betaproteobacteria bacterium]MDE2185696.1 high-potential iron-sulfur protein [Betaproteobacteria bacterium]MDE2325438.1 high-potential iron-sulfur protein [Betaproteobacteria bacterium]